MTLAPILMALATLSLIRRMHTAAAIDVIDAHYIYPDGVAAALVAGWLGVPFTVTARGSDVNLLGRYALQRRMIRWAASRAGAVIAVSGALRQALMALGCLAEKIHVLQNGVDLEEFRTLDRAAARRELGINGTTLLSVGKLDENKGHHLVIEALHELPGVRLMVVGTGPWQGRLEQQARSQDLQGRVTFLGSVTPERLRICYNAADALVLASGREGMPNVVLESLACGTRVIAHGVGGVPDIIDDAIAGRLLESRSSAAIARVARELLAVRPDPPATRKYAERFGWSRTVQAQLEVLGSVLAQGNGAVSGGDPGATRRA
jgi:glycosyltransferase involved in cell wall biosynthesis